MRRFVLLALAVGVLAAWDVSLQAAAKKAKNKIDGTWVMVSGEEDGKPIPEDAVKTAKLVIKGNEHDVTVGSATYKGTHKVDRSKTPHTIDATDEAGPFKGETTLGIFEVKGGEMKVCFAPPGKDRPTEFTTKSGTGTIFHVWKREKE